MADNQHYIPVCYLKGFSSNYPANFRENRNNLSTFVFNTKELKLIGKKGVNNIFSSNKFYNIKDDNGNEDNSIDVLLGRTEKYYSMISLALYNEYVIGNNNKDPFQRKDIKEYFARHIFSQMKRVPKFYEFMEKYIDEEFPEIDSIERKDLLNRNMICLGEQDSDRFKSAIDYFLQKDWTLFRIKDENKRVITSDNPAIMLGSDGLLKDENEIIFPINDKMFIHMSNSNSVFNRVETISSKSKYGHIFLREINFKIAIESHEYLISSNEDLLKSISKDYINKVKYNVGFIRYRLI